MALLLLSSGVSSAFTKSLPFHLGPSAVARKSVLHSVEHAQYLTRSSRFSAWAACRISNASGGLKLNTTAPLGPAAVTSFVAIASALVIGTSSVKSVIGTFAAAARALGPPAM